MNNIIFISGGAYSSVKSSLRQWIDLYAQNLEGLSFELYKNGRGSHIVKADEYLDNELFYFLVNYLKYPHGIEYNVEIEGYTIGKGNDPLKDQWILVYPNEKEYDTIYATLENNTTYKVDFNGIISKSEEGKMYRTRTIPVLEHPAILKVRKQTSGLNQEKRLKEDVEPRFEKIIILVIIAFSLNSLIPIFSSDRYFFNDFTTMISSVVSMWFVIDTEILRYPSLYKRCLMVSGAIFCYGFFIQHYFHSTIPKELMASALSPSAVLFIQWPIRKLYLALFKREPEFDKHGKFADLIYSLLLVICPLFSSLFLAQYFV